MIGSAASGSAVGLADEIRIIGLGLGLTAVGFCDAEPMESTREVLIERREQGLNAEMAFTYRNPHRSTDPRATLPSARSIVVAALRYDTEMPQRPLGESPHARVARYATADHYRELRDALSVIKGHLKGLGHKAVVLADDNAIVDRAVAVKAGIGWFGKSANVLLPGMGSWFVLGSVLTSAELVPFAEVLPDGCGNCTECLDHCPTGAIVAPGVVDARRCLSWRLQAPGDFPVEFREALGNRIYGCDDCQEFCPPSRRADRRGIGARVRDAEGSFIGDTGSWVDVSWILAASDVELLERLGRWYVPQRDPRYIRRNALVVVGNTAGELVDEQLETLVGSYLDGDDDMLKRHAVWSVLALGRHSLLSLGTRASDPVIVGEVAALGTDWLGRGRLGAGSLGGEALGREVGDGV